MGATERNPDGICFSNHRDGPLPDDRADRIETLQDCERAQEALSVLLASEATLEGKIVRQRGKRAPAESASEG